MIYVVALSASATYDGKLTGQGLRLADLFTAARVVPPALK